MILQVIGWLMVVGFFVGLFSLFVAAIGFISAVKAFAFGIFITCWYVLGVSFITK